MNRVRLRRQDGSALITALMVMLVMLPLGLALLAIVDTQARDSGDERTRDLAFNLSDSALTSAAFSLGKYAWPTAEAAAPSNTGATGTATVCSTASYGAALGAATNPGSATAKLQPNLNASYDDAAYNGATWQINVCDDDSSGPGQRVWKAALLGNWNYDRNANGLVWIRSEAHVGERQRILAALVQVGETPAMSSKYGLMTGRMNSEVTNTVGTVLGGGLLGGMATALLQTDPLVAPDPAYTTSPPTSGITAVRCGALDGCLTGAIGGVAALSLVNTLVTGGKLVQSTSPSAASDASIVQLKQQAQNSGTYVATSAGSTTSANPPACAIPAAANSTTVVYIEQVGTGDQFCLLDVSSNRAFKALVIGRGRIVLRGDNTTASGSANTFRGLLYAVNEQRATLGDAATPTREVIRIDRGARVIGGVAADGKSAQVGIYPPPACNPAALLGLGCAVTAVLNITGVLNSYNPAIRSDVALMEAVKVYSAAAVVPGTYRDIAGETAG